ncbi:acyl-CoA--sterol O-acyltransferase 1-like [Brassica napus]|uniref:acyl-CoA--sterol O-acyltransferase 1-like n=1 Tax=Brassica napus TaxID=3708 RepID=UPI00207AC2DA|nr:acyl-CoA--sterol O-acyltransferase 1-like [Brassica napus]
MATLLVLMTKVYEYNSKLPNKAVLTLYAIHIYLLLELILAATATMVRAMSGLELELQFNKPYLATSLQDFWGRRWNLAVTGILRPTVYEPMIQLFSVLDPNWSRVLAVLATFVVSGLMHELIFFYMGGLMPDWKVMWFFLVHGLCTTVEIAVKKKVNGRWRLPTGVGRVLTFGFVMVTGLWLFLPVFNRGNIFERALEEYAYAGALAAELKTIMASLL